MCLPQSLPKSNPKLYTGRQPWLAYIPREMPDTTTLFSAVSTSKTLSDTEEKIEVAGLPHVRVGNLGRRGVVVKDGIDRRIEVIAQVSAYRANGRVVAQAQPHGMGEVVEVAGVRRVVRGVGLGNVAAGIAMGLLDTQRAGPYLAGPLKGVPHVMEQNKTEIGAHPAQSGRRRAEFERVDEHASTTHRITGLGITRPSRIDRKATMRGSAAGIKPLG